MREYKLLTPGPLTTTDSVRQQMLVDRCTWDADYKELTQKIRRQLLEIAGVSEEKYTTVLLQGSGSFGVEGTLNSASGREDKSLFIVNGAYGERMVHMAKRMGLNHEVYKTDYCNAPDLGIFKAMLEKDQYITHVAMVHCETTTGILNPIEEIAKICKEKKRSSY